MRVKDASGIATAMGIVEAEEQTVGGVAKNSRDFVFENAQRPDFGAVGCFVTPYVWCAGLQFGDVGVIGGFHVMKVGKTAFTCAY